MRNVTIKDIAKVANVSYATVSRALSGSPEISEETRSRVLKICGDLGYTPNYVARSMVVRQTKLIGLIVASVDNPFMSELAYHIEINARKYGYNIMLCNSSGEPKLEEEVFTLLMGRQVDGIILVPASADTYGTLKKHLNKMPTVFVSENLKDAPESYVAVDNARGTYLGMEYLYGLGHREILYFGRRKRSATHQMRAEGYLSACADFGLTPHILDSGFSSSSIPNGHHLAKQLFAKPLPYTAIFAAADTMALGILQAADEAGIRVPEDVSLLGFDNIHYTDLPKINLSTIEQPKAAMAATAVDMMVDKIRNASSGYSHRILMPTLLTRASCRRLGDGTNAV